MEFRDEAHRQAVRAAFIRMTADPTWPYLKQIFEESIYNLELKSINEDDEDKAKIFRYDARGARKLWQWVLEMVELVQSGDPAPKNNDFLEVVM